MTINRLVALAYNIAKIAKTEPRGSRQLKVANVFEHPVNRLFHIIHAEFN